MTAPSQTRAARSPGSRPTARRPVKRVEPSQFATARAGLTTWLSRPLTSLHLVVGVFGLLTLLGLVMVLSASNVESYTEQGTSYGVFGKQLAYACVGLVLFWIAMRFPLRLLRGSSSTLLVVTLGLLVLVLTPFGATVNGSQSWFRYGPLSFQPTEVAKLALALWGAHVLVSRRGTRRRWRALLVPVVPVAVMMFALVMMQPDLGTTITLAIVLLALLWFAGAPSELFGLLVILAGAGAVTMAGIAGYRSDRVESFLQPGQDPQGAAFQSRQALYSLADGGWFGVGLGQGSAKWDYLPNAHNDFIFAIIGEELGFLGCLLVLVLYGTVAYVGLRISARNTDPWIKVVSATLTMWLVAQAAINIGYVVGLLPVTGLPLPLISSGGTSIIMTMVVFGLLANFARHEPEAVSALRATGGAGSAGPGRLARLLRISAPTPRRPKRDKRPKQQRPERPQRQPSARTRQAPSPRRQQPAGRQKVPQQRSTSPSSPSRRRR